jgi:DNA polymerase/3'-5' exonuclease PolX
LARRIDILSVPRDEMGAALIYFTGNDVFNRYVRGLAHKKVNTNMNAGKLFWIDLFLGNGFESTWSV